MQPSSSARKAWDETMAQMGQGPRAKDTRVRRRGKRASGKFRDSGGNASARLDEETKRQIRNAQLDAYEADNYKNIEEEPEEEYEDLNEDEV